MLEKNTATQFNSKIDSDGWPYANVGQTDRQLSTRVKEHKDEAWRSEENFLGKKNIASWLAKRAIGI